MAKTKAKPQTKQRTFEWRDLFEGSRKWFVITPSFLLFVGLCWWAYDQLTAIPPPEPKTASIEKLKEFIGDERGIGRLSAPQCEQFLTRTYAEIARRPPEERARMIRSVEQMTPAQKQVFGNALAGVMKKHVVDASKTYNGLRTPMQKTQFAQKFMGDLRKVQSNMIGGPGAGGAAEAGGANPGFNLGPALKEVTPTSPQEIQKAVLNNSSPSERAGAEDLISKLADIHRDEINQKVRGG